MLYVRRWCNGQGIETERSNAKVHNHMIVNEDVINFIRGEDFSNGHNFSVQRQKVFSRNKLLSDMSKGKNILHVGCADHIPLISRKRKAGTYLHDILVESSDLVIGSDTNLSALEEMRKYGISNLYHADDVPSDIKFDLILIPDVIEHVTNVQSFLQAFWRYECPIVVSTPNSYRLINRMQ
jgi:2-polyprenyl-3-methyl-5-hydroxy-6-metoxy-1,4-benzoquinol methylase